MLVPLIIVADGRNIEEIDNWNITSRIMNLLTSGHEKLVE